MQWIATISLLFPTLCLRVRRTTAKPTSEQHSIVFNQCTKADDEKLLFEKPPGACRA